MEFSLPLVILVQLAGCATDSGGTIEAGRYQPHSPVDVNPDEAFLGDEACIQWTKVAQAEDTIRDGDLIAASRVGGGVCKGGKYAAAGYARGDYGYLKFSVFSSRGTQDCEYFYHAEVYDTELGKHYWFFYDHRREADGTCTRIIGESPHNREMRELLSDAPTD